MSKIVIQEGKSSSSSGISFLSLLTLLFVGLKLTGYIKWSWKLVLLPIYGPALIVLIVLFCIVVYKVFKAYQADKKNNDKKEPDTTQA